MAGYATASMTESGTVIIHMFDGQGKHVDMFEADGVFLRLTGDEAVRFLGGMEPPPLEIFTTMLAEIARVGGNGITARRAGDEDHEQV